MVKSSSYVRGEWVLEIKDEVAYGFSLRNLNYTRVKISNIQRFLTGYKLVVVLKKLCSVVFYGAPVTEHGINSAKERF